MPLKANFFAITFIFTTFLVSIAAYFFYQKEAGSSVPVANTLTLQESIYSQQLENKVLALKLSFNKALITSQQNTTSTIHQHAINISNFPVKTGYISSRFGLRKDPIHGHSRLHKGLDIAARSGTFVYALGKGKVIFSGYKKGFGNVVEIQHGSSVISRYAHLDMSLIDVGREIDGSEILGVVGTTGRSTGPHLHLEVHFNGKAVNPEPYLSKVRPTSVAQVKKN